MPNYAKEMDLDLARLERRVTFLIERADFHHEVGTFLDLGCAATARRDAAVLTLLLGKIEKSRALFRKAGAEWTEIGLYAGFLLESFADADEDIVNKDKAGILSAIREASEKEWGAPPPSERGWRPFEEASRNSARQLLNLYQAIRGGRQQSGMTVAFSYRLKERMTPSFGSIVGATGIPIKSYIELFDSFTNNEPTQRQQQLIQYLITRREELIAAARMDAFHWRMMLKPAEFVDMDLLALGLSAFEAGPNSNSAKVLLQLSHNHEVGAGLPFLLAADMRKSKDEPQPLYR